ncbi:uncharacterized protein LOC108670880 isoform X2 [Hyalella azteca]|uniref:Uncharacterized protein LOC108670880 isoform X2 n=1 Tax=Hyalella azteca TaxID=294128 RepID=A0A979FGG6_HYAAZ|nr:uncharacterized protein LOC108670880 isoform X2 [Hyalella azteca]
MCICVRKMFSSASSLPIILLLLSSYKASVISAEIVETNQTFSSADYNSTATLSTDGDNLHYHLYENTKEINSEVEQHHGRSRRQALRDCGPDRSILLNGNKFQTGQTSIDLQILLTNRFSLRVDLNLYDTGFFTSGEDGFSIDVSSENFGIYPQYEYSSMQKWVHVKVSALNHNGYWRLQVLANGKTRLQDSNEKIYKNIFQNMVLELYPNSLWYIGAETHRCTTTTSTTTTTESATLSSSTTYPSTSRTTPAKLTAVPSTTQTWLAIIPIETTSTLEPELPTTVSEIPIGDGELNTIVNPKDSANSSSIDFALNNISAPSFNDPEFNFNLKNTSQPNILTDAFMALPPELISSTLSLRISFETPPPEVNLDDDLRNMSTSTITTETITVTARSLNDSSSAIPSFSLNPENTVEQNSVFPGVIALEVISTLSPGDIHIPISESSLPEEAVNQTFAQVAGEEQGGSAFAEKSFMVLVLATCLTVAALISVGVIIYKCTRKGTDKIEGTKCELLAVSSCRISNDGHPGKKVPHEYLGPSMAMAQHEQHVERVSTEPQAVCAAPDLNCINQTQETPIGRTLSCTTKNEDDVHESGKCCFEETNVTSRSGKSEVPARNVSMPADVGSFESNVSKENVLPQERGGFTNRSDVRIEVDDSHMQVRFSFK